MKNKTLYKMSAIAIMLIVSIAVLSTCKPKGGNDMLSAELETKIKQDWQEQFGTELTINYYGTHNDYVVFFVPGMETVITNVKIAGTIFRGNNSWTIYLWKNGSFSNMIDAYQQGLLTAEDIEKIGFHHRETLKKSWIGSENSFNEWYFNTDDICSIIE
ncbi:MAG: hypothetical protein LBT20_02520 [Clostridiales bacterium]|jgi:hypothetical protein|nr:hypothetical protein [Clostridiales bacterium]